MTGLYGNGMMDADAMKAQVENVTETFNSMRRAILAETGAIDPIDDGGEGGMDPTSQDGFVTDKWW